MAQRKGGGVNEICANTDYQGCGTVFRMSPAGKLTTLYTFCSQSGCTDGAQPWAGLVQGSDGNFYGTTSVGGSANSGTVFKITPSGALTTLYSFCALANCSDGSQPGATLIEGTDGNFYGTTNEGGGANQGTVFQITPGGTLTTLHAFCLLSSCDDGYGPIGALVQGTNGTFYGTVANGGGSIFSVGNIFSLSMGLGPFVRTQTSAGRVGSTVIILGTNLTGATAVSFNGTTAAFKVVQSSEIQATVPAGATTGPVTAVTPSGTLQSNAAFVVTP